MKYLIIDESYGIYKTDVFTGRIRSQLKKGKLSVIRLDTLQGMNIDGWTWEDLPLWGEVILESIKEG